ncbi:MAG: glycosyltransferase, partial [Chthoniobacterales bacterium]
MSILRRLLGRRERDLSGADLFDVQHAGTRAAWFGSTGKPSGAGEAVREFYLHSPEVQWRYPLGLLPIGQRRFVKWLLGKGRAQHGFSDAEVLAFLAASAADLPRQIALTYAVNPDWQRRFPQLSAGGRELIEWLRAEFPKYRPLRKITTLPSLPFSTASDSAAGVNFLAHFCYPSGLQQAALGYKTSLEAVGLRVSCRDVPSGVRTDLEVREPWLGREEFAITITNVAPAPHFETRYRRAGLAERDGVYRIAYWAWELESIPAEWAELATTVDEIWAPTPFVAEAMRKSVGVPVHEMLPGLTIGPIATPRREDFGLAADDFVFLFMFDMLSTFERKNPLAVVRAFRRAFNTGEKAQLVIKISRATAEPEKLAALEREAGGANIIVVDELVPRAEAYGYIALADCVISLHRSEGFGMLVAEAMLLGKPVI